MFICNFKVNGNKLGKIFLGILFVIILLITFLVCYRILGNNSFKTNANEVYNITSTNYTNILKVVHENVDNYVGQKIKFSGYVHRMVDFNQNQFVLARNMVISSDLQTVIVGFLCEYDESVTYEDNAWVEIQGQITKGDYHGEMPIIKIEKMQKIEKPSEEFVYPPDDSFVTTSTIL